MAVTQGQFKRSLSNSIRWISSSNMIIVRKALNNGRVDKYNGWVTLLALLSLIIGLIDFYLNTPQLAAVGIVRYIRVSGFLVYVGVEESVPLCLQD